MCQTLHSSVVHRRCAFDGSVSSSLPSSCDGDGDGGDADDDVDDDSDGDDDDDD